MPRPCASWWLILPLVVCGGFAVSGCSESVSTGYTAYQHTTPEDAEEQTGMSVPPAQAESATSPETDSTDADSSPAKETASGEETATDSTAATATAPDEVTPVAALSPSEAQAVPKSLTIGATALPDQKLVPRKVEVLVKTRDFKAEGPQGALRVSYDDLDLLKVLNMDPVTRDAVKFMPEWLRNLDGKRIRVRGFMYPTFTESGIDHFILARDNQICCFGRNPKIYDLIDVTLQPDRTTNYIQGRPFDVVGTLHIDLQDSGGELLGLYFIDDAILIDK